MVYLRLWEPLTPVQIRAGPPLRYGGKPTKLTAFQVAGCLCYSAFFIMIIERISAWVGPPSKSGPPLSAMRWLSPPVQYAVNLAEDGLVAVVRIELLRSGSRTVTQSTRHELDRNASVERPLAVGAPDVLQLELDPGDVLHSRTQRAVLFDEGFTPLRRCALGRCARSPDGAWPWSRRPSCPLRPLPWRL